MQDIRVGAVQVNGLLNAVEKNLSELKKWVHKAADKGAELILFPETFLQGHVGADPIWESAEKVPGGPCVKRLEKIASEYDVFLSVGMTEKERDICYNTQVLVSPQGYVGKSRKVHLSADERLGFKAGTEMPVFNIGKCHVGQSICYDTINPELCRTLVLKGAEVILMPHSGRCGAWKTVIEEKACVSRMKRQFTAAYPMRAMENACFLVICNQVGNAGRVKYYPPRHWCQPIHAGGCAVIGPTGDIIVESKTQRAEPEMVVCDLSADEFTKARSSVNSPLMTRRPELYDTLTAEPGSIQWD